MRGSGGATRKVLVAAVVAVLVFAGAASQLGGGNGGTSLRVGNRAETIVEPPRKVQRSPAAMLSRTAGTAASAFRFHPLHSNSPQASWREAGGANGKRLEFKSVQELAKAIADGRDDHGGALDGSASTVLGDGFNRLFTISRRTTNVVVPPAFQDRVKGMFAAYPGGTAKLDFIEKQTIVTTYNRMTEEYSLFNEVRRYRPGYQERLSADKDAEVNDAIMKSAGAATCDFCSVERTAEDVFGRVFGQHCYTASNVAKYEKWHSLLIAKEHHPLNITRDMMVDYIETAHAWFAQVHRRDPTARFPHIMFDAGARASASQPHQHLQMSMTANRYFTRAEHTRLAAVDYYEGHYAAGPDGEPAASGHSYWADLVSAHEGLGLALRFNRSAVLSYITPIKERELVVVTESSHSPCFGALIAAAVNSLTDGVGTRAFSMAVTLEPYGVPVTRRGRRAANVPYPALARIVDRGSPLDQRSDVGAMEFYGANNIGADPYSAVPHLAQRVRAMWAAAAAAGQDPLPPRP